MHHYVLTSIKSAGGGGENIILLLPTVILEPSYYASSPEINNKLLSKNINFRIYLGTIRVVNIWGLYMK